MVRKVSNISKDVATLKINFKGVISNLKEELDVHLDSINQNTNEIQSNYEYLAELDAKIDKLTEKIDNIQMELNPEISKYQHLNINLSKKEQEFFMNLYTVEDRISINELAKKSGITYNMCISLIDSFNSKGIPIVKQIVEGELLISLEYNFKDIQARKNILMIDSQVVKLVD